MKLSDLLLTALGNLWQRKARTLLTVLGVVIGTMAIVMMVALGEGSQRMFMEQ
ncbi:MAG: ABC transporter permease, partial [Eubacteriales bacterium]|nr:ABC transporter permease [Eubacteriales bacterium]